MNIKQQVLKALETYPEMTSTQIADLCGCTRAYVSMICPGRKGHGGNEVVPQVKMCLSTWYLDEFGNRCRIIEGVAA